jgi:hypothetical protein
MELVEGEDLHGPMGLEEAMAIARQIALGLEAAHEWGSRRGYAVRLRSQTSPCARAGRL